MKNDPLMFLLLAATGALWGVVLLLAVALYSEGVCI